MFTSLSKVYSYTNPDYLEANRRGEITPEQAKLLGLAWSFLSRIFQWGKGLNGIAVILALVFFFILQLTGIEISAPLALGVFGLVLVLLAVQLGTRFSKSRRQRRVLAEDLQRGIIRDGVGSLNFQRGSYTVLTPDGELYLPYGRGEGLAPGVSYRFYYLQNSRMVLSAESLGEVTPGAVESGLTAILAEANSFKLSSLEANRRGELTPEQSGKLYSSLVAPLILILVPAGALYYYLLQVGYLQEDTLASLLARVTAGGNTGLLVLGGVLLAMAVWGLVLLILTLLDVFGRSVSKLEGIGYRKVSTTTDDDGSTTTRYYYVIGGSKFRVQRSGFSAFEDGLTYRAYFTPWRKVLVNLEVLE